MADASLTSPVSEVIRDPEVLRNVRGMLDEICRRWNEVNRIQALARPVKK